MAQLDNTSKTLRIKNWDRWQSYRRDRGQPPWIKIHRRLMRNLDWIELTDAQRGQLIAIWLLAADRDGQVPANPEDLRRLCFMQTIPDINLFIEKGFLDAIVTPRRRRRDATVTPGRRQHDAPKAETEAEAKAETKSVNGADAPVAVLKEDFSKKFWPAYPHKVGKAAALKSYLAARRKVSEAEIAAGVARYVASKPPDRPWCNPATFLNQERWTDEPASIGQAGEAKKVDEAWRKKLKQTEQEMAHDKDREVH